MNHSELRKVTILFAGDSGDGIQLTGSEFTQTAALYGNDLRTFPDFPAEIRAPQGTLAGVSGFKLNFGSAPVHTPGDRVDVLVVMNAAALRKNIDQVKENGIVMANTSGFARRDLVLAGYPADADPLKELEGKYRLISLNVTKLTREALKDTSLGMKDRDRSRNMFVLGFLYWLYNRPMEWTEKFLTEKFARLEGVAEANRTVLRAGYNYGEITEASLPRFVVKKAHKDPGSYRNITGNQAVAIGLVAAAEKSGMSLFYGSYPITPASDILHELSRHKNFGVRTFQAEDEIAAITAAIGASFGGHLGVTASSGPGISLKLEAMGLAVMLELPLVVINVQRGGPSTGLPTKTEQSDLLQALYGRNGEAPMPVFAARSPADAFETAFEAAQYAIEHMTPVMLLSDGFIANGSEPWKFPGSSDLPRIHPPRPNVAKTGNEPHLPYKRDERLVRNWAIPGQAGGEHRVGGLEKELETGNVSYEAVNHEQMVKIRAAKIDLLKERYPDLKMDEGENHGEVLVLGWGSTYGAIRVAVQQAALEGHAVSHLHLRHIHPMHKDLGAIISGFKKVLIPEMNNGQLVKVIRDKYLVDAVSLNKIQGQPFTPDEIYEGIGQLLNTPVKSQEHE